MPEILVQTRITKEERDQIKIASAISLKTMQEWVFDTLNRAAKLEIKNFALKNVHLGNTNNGDGR